ncbi:hypothetical protein TIFTF001_043842 [Ficus carica]|uniref:Uncharacterized protein n=1 Tax=Ficus carica TaxID=3494 RepID=A0AA87YWA1_FICCA|nr:hypothetical protein TIFTF001_043839 [Ficus carica]GMN25004.1 hypothetical protein TIFTF001_043842 [Ficus carica]
MELSCVHSTIDVQGRNRVKPENIIYNQSKPQQGATAAEQTRSPPSNPTVDESIPLQASSHADNSMQQLKTWKGGDRCESSGGGSEHIRGGIVEVDSSRGGGEDKKSEGGGKNNGSIGDIINGGGDFEVEDDTNAPPNVHFDAEINVERDMEDSHINEFFYQTSICSSDGDCEEDVLDVEQPKK